MARSSFSSGVMGDSPLGVTLPTRISPGLNLGADINDADLVEVAEALLADVGNVASNVLGAELGIARHDLELLDVNRGEDVIARPGARK